MMFSYKEQCEVSSYFGPQNPPSGADIIRCVRNTRLKESDWTQMADVQLSAEEKQLWDAYRKDLRDISSQEQFPNFVVWPTPPVNL